MYAVRSILILFLISLVSSAYVAPRDECYHINTSTTFASLPPNASYAFSNSTSAQQCQVAITSWVTTTVTVTSSLGYVNSSAFSSTTTSYVSNNALPAVKRSAFSTTKATSNMPSTITTVNVNSVLSEFASIYSALAQYEYNATANSTTATADGSFNISAFSAATDTSSSNSSTANATSSPTTCASSCPSCTTVFYYATTTIIATTPPPSPIATLPPITLGNATYTPTGTYYVIDNSTLSPGGFAILFSNSTLLSLSPSGTELVIAPLSPTAGGPGPSTYDLSPAPASSPPLTTPTSTSTSTPSNTSAVVEVALATITGPYNLPVVVFPSSPIVIAGTTITPGASAVTIRRTPVSLAPSSDFIVFGSSTVTLAKTTITSGMTSTSTPTTATTATSSQAKVGSLIWSGIGGTEPGSSATSTKTATSATATFTSNNATYIGQVFTGACVRSRGKVGSSLWLGLGLGLGFATGWSIVMTFMISILLSIASTSIWAFEARWPMLS